MLKGALPFQQTEPWRPVSDHHSPATVGHYLVRSLAVGWLLRPQYRNQRSFARRRPETCITALSRADPVLTRVRLQPTGCAPNCNTRECYQASVPHYRHRPSVGRLAWVLYGAKTSWAQRGPIVEVCYGYMCSRLYSTRAILICGISPSPDDLVPVSFLFHFFSFLLLSPFMHSFSFL